MLITILYAIGCFSFVYYLSLTLWYTLLLVAAYPEVLEKFKQSRYSNAKQLINENSLVPITIVTPVYNEEKDLLNMVYSVLNSEYKNVQLILINDGSTDNTMELLKQEFLLYEIPNTIHQIIKTEPIRHCYKSERFANILVLDKGHSPWNTSADSYNAGLNACQTPLMLTVDADTILEPESLTQILFTMLATPNCVVVGGTVYVLNENRVENGKMITSQLPKQYFPGLQAVEYARSFLYARAGLNSLGGSLCYPGAYTLFETEVLRAVGGYDTPNFGGDAEITTKIHRYMRENNLPHALKHSSNSFCWTDVPDNYKSYWKQRTAWQRGMCRQTMLHKTMLLNPKYGIVGLLTFPAYVIYDLLGSVIEFISLITFLICLFLGLFEFNIFLWFIALAWGFTTFISIAVLFLNQISFNKYKRKGDFLRIIAYSTAEMFGLHQYRALCCTAGTIQYAINRLRGKPL